MFIFIIARTPLSLRSPLREELWKISKESLLAQSSKNWKAIIIGDTKNEELNSDFFITLDFDNYSKIQKINCALDYLKNNRAFKTDYVIRFDDDDIFSQNCLKKIDDLPEKYDCYFDSYHTFVDSVYLKISHKKNNWIANTAIHKYEHAISLFGAPETALLNQDHSEYWHIYYKDKKTYSTSKNEPLYYRILTPFSISSINSNVNNTEIWKNYLMYLKGYGPWITLSASLPFYASLNKISVNYFQSKPKMSLYYWVFNSLKYFLRSFKK
jgi:hypothetical protein